MLGQLRDTYSRVIIDAPAMQPFSDAALLAANADCTVLVLRRGRVTRELLKSSLRNLELVNARLAGVVLTALPLRRPKRFFTARSGRAAAPAAGAAAPAGGATVFRPVPPVKRAAARR